MEAGRKRPVRWRRLPRHPRFPPRRQMKTLRKELKVSFFRADNDSGREMSASTALVLLVNARSASSEQNGEMTAIRFAMGGSQSYAFVPGR